MERLMFSTPRRSRRPRAPWRRWFPALAVLALLILAPVFAFAQGAGADTVRLSWTAPGDDDQVGTAAEYELRFSTSPITEAEWTNATSVASLPAPAVAGTPQSFTVQGLTRGTTYWFAIKTRDDAGNWSAISNVVRWDWILDLAPPASPSGLVATRSDPSVDVLWNPGAEPDLAGYHVYRSLASSGPWTRLNGAIVPAAGYTDADVPQGVTSVWYAVTAADGNGNESARSAPASVTYSSQTAASAPWSLGVGYPNPARLGDLVRIPFVVPSGAGAARLEVHDAAGRRVRAFDLGYLASGAQEVGWDGLNEFGRSVAPGAYRAWLIAGDTRVSTRLVRVP